MSRVSKSGGRQDIYSRKSFLSLLNFLVVVLKFATIKKSRIQETPTLLTNADSSTDTISFLNFYLFGGVPQKKIVLGGPNVHHPLCFLCLVSHVLCHVSLVICHMSRVT